MTDSLDLQCTSCGDWSRDLTSTANSDGVRYLPSPRKVGQNLVRSEWLILPSSFRGPGYPAIAWCPECIGEAAIALAKAQQKEEK